MSASHNPEHGSGSVRPHPDPCNKAVVRSNLVQSSILRKLIGYGATHRSGLHTAMYGLPNFRVLTETIGPKRVENMITESSQRHLARTYPPGLFLFADRHSLFAAEDFLDHEWLDG